MEHPTESTYTGATPIMGGGVLLLGILVAAVLWCNPNQYIDHHVFLWSDWCNWWLCQVVHRRRIESGKSEKNIIQIKRTESVLVSSFLVNLGGSGSRPWIVPLCWYRRPSCGSFCASQRCLSLFTEIFVHPIHAVDHRGRGECCQSHRWYGFSGDGSLMTVLFCRCGGLHRRRFWVCGEAEDSAFDPWNQGIICTGNDGLVQEQRLNTTHHQPWSTWGISVPWHWEHGFGHVHFCQSGIVSADCGRDFIFPSSLPSSRLFFKWMLHTRAGAELSFFLRSPYHHHLQRLWTYNRNPSDVESVWLIFLKKIGINPVPEENKLLTTGS